MGNWSITIEGIGPHHNPGNQADAEKIGKVLVSALQKAGHSITHASIHFGGAEPLLIIAPHPKEKP